MDINEQRYVNLFNTVNYFAFGTLWKIKNSLWHNVIYGFVSKNDAAYHPAVSLGRKDLTSLYQTVPMLLGSHSQKTGFRISDFTGTTRGRIGFFRIRPYYFFAADAAGANRGISRNEHKPCLEQTENTELKAYLQRKGVKFDE